MDQVRSAIEDAGEARGREKEQNLRWREEKKVQTENNASKAYKHHAGGRQG